MLTDVRYQLLFNYCVLQIVKSLKIGATKATVTETTNVKI